MIASDANGGAPTATRIQAPVKGRSGVLPHVAGNNRISAVLSEPDRKRARLMGRHGKHLMVDDLARTVVHGEQDDLRATAEVGCVSAWPAAGFGSQIQLSPDGRIQATAGELAAAQRRSARGDLYGICMGLT